MIAGRNINNLRYANDTTLMAEGHNRGKIKSHPFQIISLQTRFPGKCEG